MKMIAKQWGHLLPVKANQGKTGKFFSKMLHPHLARREAQKDELLQMLSFTYRQEIDFKRDYKPGELKMAIEFFHDPLLNHLRFLADGAGLFMANPEKNARWKDRIYTELDGIGKFYASLPYEKMKGKPGCYPLFAIREMLPLLRFRVDSMFDSIERGEGQIDAGYWHDAVVRANNAIMEVHVLYVNNMRKLAQKIGSDGAGWDRPISWKVELPELPQNPEKKSLRILKQEARGLARFYFMGMGARLADIAHSSESYLQNLKSNKACGKDLYHMSFCIRETSDCYSLIPFETLHGNSAYYPLFVANVLLPMLKSETTALQSSNNQEKEKRVRRIEILAYTIHTIGDGYRNRISKLLKEIHEMPGGAGFGVVFPPHMSTGISKRMEAI